MSQEFLQGSDKLNSAYQKINRNFSDVYAGIGGGGGGVTNLEELSDVAITDPIGNNQALIYDNVAEKWENQDIPRALGALSDVDLVTNGALLDGQLLEYDGASSKWEHVSNSKLVNREIRTSQVLSLMGVV